MCCINFLVFFFPKKILALKDAGCAGCAAPRVSASPMMDVCRLLGTFDTLCAHRPEGTPAAAPARSPSTHRETSAGRGGAGGDPRRGAEAHRQRPQRLTERTAGSPPCRSVRRPFDAFPGTAVWHPPRDEASPTPFCPSLGVGRASRDLVGGRLRSLAIHTRGQETRWRPPHH